MSHFNRHLMKRREKVDYDSLIPMLIDSPDGVHKQYRLDDSNGEEFNLFKKYKCDIIKEWYEAPKVRTDPDNPARKYYKTGIVAWDPGTTLVRTYGPDMSRLFVDGKFYKTVRSADTTTVPAGVSKYAIGYAKYYKREVWAVYPNYTEESFNSERSCWLFQPLNFQIMVNGCGFIDQIHYTPNYQQPKGIGEAYITYNSMFKIPSNLVGSYNGAFRSARFLGGIYIPFTFKEFDSLAFWYNQSLPMTCPIIVYEGSVEDWCRLKFGNNYRPNPMMVSLGTLYFNTNTDVVETHIKIPDDVTELCAHFAAGVQFTSIENTEHITRLDFYAFSRCSITFNWNMFPNLTYIGYGAFYYKTTWVDLNIPEGITYIGDGAFQDTIISGDNGVVTIPSTCTELGVSALNGITNMKEVRFTEPCQITYLKNALVRASPSIEKFTIPTSVTKIHSLAFWDTPKLKYINYNGTIEQFKSNITIEGEHKYIEGRIIRCTDGDYTIEALETS